MINLTQLKINNGKEERIINHVLVNNNKIEVVRVARFWSTIKGTLARNCYVVRFDES